MDESESKAAGVIAKNIDQLESATDFAASKMDQALFEAVCDILNKKNKDLGWESNFGSEFGDQPWLAPFEWRAVGADVGGDYDLVCYLDFKGADANTWLAYFAGVAGRRVYLSVSTNTVSGKKNLKNLAQSIGGELQKLIDAGFLFDIEEFAIKRPIGFNREEISAGFADDDLSQALAPIGRALDDIVGLRDTLDRIRDAVRVAVA